MTKKARKTTVVDAKPPRHDLEERTARFGEGVIKFVKKIPVTAVTEPLIRQLVRTGTSIGANYCRVDAESKKEFRSCIDRCERESAEAKYWLRMIAAAVPLMKGEARNHWKEAKELNLIFAAIYRSKKNV